MQVRLSTRQDLEAIAVILAEAFKEEKLHAHMFPGRERWPEDYIRCWRECVGERWWDYSTVWVVAIEEGTQSSEGCEQKEDCEPSERTELRILGVAEWRRAGLGWERLWGCLPMLDPREYYLLRWSLLRSWRSGREECAAVAVPNNGREWAYACPGNAIQYPVKGLHHWNNWRALNRSIRKQSSADPSPINKLNFGSRIEPFMQGMFPHDTYWELCTLAVDPSSRLGGVGKALVNWRLNSAEQETLPAVVVCAKDTEDFYLRCGCSVVTGVASEAKVDGIMNPLTARGFGGGSVLWTRSDRIQMG